MSCRARAGDDRAYWSYYVLPRCDLRIMIARLLGCRGCIDEHGNSVLTGITE